MKKLLLGLLLVSSLALTGCNKQLVDLNYRYNKIHLYETDTCYAISSWTDYENGEQLQVHITGKGKILISSTDCFLVEDKCPICD